jgi:hypothetical protein
LKETPKSILAEKHLLKNHLRKRLVEIYSVFLTCAEMLRTYFNFYKKAKAEQKGEIKKRETFKKQSPSPY